jgi:hypothetical protein
LRSISSKVNTVNFTLKKPSVLDEQLNILEILEHKNLHHLSF